MNKQFYNTFTKYSKLPSVSTISLSDEVTKLPVERKLERKLDSSTIIL